MARARKYHSDEERRVAQRAASQRWKAKQTPEQLAAALVKQREYVKQRARDPEQRRRAQAAVRRRYRDDAEYRERALAWSRKWNAQNRERKRAAAATAAAANAQPRTDSPTAPTPASPPAAAMVGAAVAAVAVVALARALQPRVLGLQHSLVRVRQLQRTRPFLSASLLTFAYHSVASAAHHSRVSSPVFRRLGMRHADAGLVLPTAIIMTAIWSAAGLRTSSWHSLPSSFSRLLPSRGV